MDEREWRENRGPDEPLDLCHECGVSAGMTRGATRRDALAAVAPTAAEREAAAWLVKSNEAGHLFELRPLVAYVDRVRALVEGETQ